MLVEWIKVGKPSALGAASGVVAGLVVITPAAGFVTPAAALLMGLMAGVVCYSGVMLKHKLGYDDSLDAFGVHGIGGAFGALATGVFASVGATGLLAGNVHQLLVQLIGVVAAGAYAVVVTVHPDGDPQGDHGAARFQGRRIDGSRPGGPFGSGLQFLSHAPGSFGRRRKAPPFLCRTVTRLCSIVSRTGSFRSPSGAFVVPAGAGCWRENAMFIQGPFLGSPGLSRGVS